MEIAANPKAIANRHEKTPSLGEQLLSGKVLFVVYVIAAVAATISKLILKDRVFNGMPYHQMINFGVYRAGFFHLIQHKDIYASFPLEAPPDIFKYSPAFALFMAPFAVLPYALGATLWNLLNAVVLFAGVWAIPRVGDRGKALVLWFILLRVIENMQNAQSDALVAGLMLAAWAAMEREKPLLSSFCLASSVFIKLFGGIAVLPILMIGPWRKHWPRLVNYGAMWTALLAAAPLLVVSPQQLLFLYRSWYARLQVDAATKEGLSVAALLQHWSHRGFSGFYVLAAGAAILLAVFLLRTDAYEDFRFRILAMSSVLIFAVIFNHMSESASMVIAVTGVATWYFLEPPNLINGILTALVLVFTILWPTAIIPGALRHYVMHGNLLVFSLPCMLVWLKLQYDLLRFPRSPVPDD